MFGCPARAILGTFNTAGGDGGPAIQAQLFSPTGLARDSTGNTYIADTSNNRVRKVTAAGVISTIAGNGIAASSGDGGLATQASLNVPGGVAVDRQGNVYISESGGLRVRRIAPDGTIGTFAGVGRAGFSGDGSPARAAMLNFPADLAVDSQGNVYVLDVINARVRRISTDGTINTVLGAGIGTLGDPDGMAGTTVSFPSLSSLAAGANGDLFAIEQGLVVSLDSKGIVHDVTGPAGSKFFTPAEGVSARQTYINATAVGTLPDGTLAVQIPQNNGNNGQLWQIRSDGSLHKIADTKAGRYLLGAENGTVLLSSGHSVFAYSSSGQETTFAGAPVPGFSGDGGPASLALVSYIGGIAVDSSGNLFVSDTGNNRIRRITPAGQISTFAGTGGTTSSGDGGPALQAQIFAPGPLAFDPAGNLYVAESDGLIVRKISPSGTITRFAGPSGVEPTGVSFFAAAIAADGKGQIFLLDLNSNVIWKIGLDGTIQLFASTQPDYSGGSDQAQIWTDSAGNLLFLDPNEPVLKRFSPSGQMISRDSLSAYVRSPTAFTVDAQGNIYAANAFGKIFKLPPAGSVSTVWDSVLAPNYSRSIFPLTTDASGDIYFVDQVRNRVFEIVNAASCATAQRPLVALTGAFNAASYQQGVAAPGEIVTLFGIGVGPAQAAGPSIIDGHRFDVEAGNTRVLFDGTPGPVVYASSSQVSAIAPYSIAGQAYTRVSVEVSGAASDAIAVSVTDAAPGIFTRDGSGKGQAAALNQDYSPNSSSKPASVGSTVMLFATGEGVTKPAGVDGIIAGAIAPRPVLPVTATLDGQPASVAYAGGAPFEVAGVLQVNVKIPPTARTGAAIPIQIQIGTHASADGVTIAIQ